MTAATLRGTITTRVRPKANPATTAAEGRNDKARQAFLLLLLTITVFIAAAFTHNFIPSASMEPNLLPGDHIVTMREWLAYPFGAMPQRGDIIVFRLPHTPQPDGPQLTSSDTVGAATLSNGAGSSAENSDDDEENATGNGNSGKPEILIKRVVGLPGDIVQLKGNTLFVNGKPVHEPYPILPVDNHMGYDYPYAVYDELRIPPGHLFVLGDNRNNSDDGRYWGTLPRENVLGRFIRVLYHESKYDLPESDTFGKDE